MLITPPVALSRITLVYVFLLNRTFDRQSVVPSCPNGSSPSKYTSLGEYIFKAAFPGMFTNTPSFLGAFFFLPSSVGWGTENIFSKS